MINKNLRIIIVKIFYSYFLVQHVVLVLILRFQLIVVVRNVAVWSIINAGYSMYSRLSLGLVADIYKVILGYPMARCTMG
jgi:hypothetical protein